MNNPIFVEQPVIGKNIENITDDFRKKTLFYQIKENDVWLKQNIKNKELLEFIESKNKNNNFQNYIKFYQQYYKNLFEINIYKDFLYTIFGEFLEFISKNGYITKSDFKKIASKEKFINYKTTYNSYSYYFKKEKEFILLLKDFKLTKKNLFLDFTEDEDKININIELISFVGFDISETYIKDRNLNSYLILKKLVYIFFVTSSINNEIADGLSKYYNKIFGQKFSKTETFYVTYFNKLFIDLKIIKEEIKNDYDFLKSNNYIKKNIGVLFEAKNEQIYSNEKFLLLFLKNIILIDSESEQFIFGKNIFDDILETGGKKELKIYENITRLEIISKDIKQIYTENIKKEIYQKFLENGTINKKNFNYTKNNLIDQLDLEILKKGFEDIVEDFFDFSKQEKYHIFLEPLYLASKKFVNSNCNYGNIFKIGNDFSKKIINYKNKFKDKILNLDDFVIDFFEENMGYYLFFSELKLYFLDKIGNKIDDKLTYNMVFGEKVLFKRLLKGLADLGIVDLYGNYVKKEVSYLSGIGYGRGYGYSDNYEEIEIFEPEYIKFKDFNLNFDIPKDNYILGNDIYLSIKTDIKNIHKISFFTKLEKIESHIILSFSRDELIKAKNTYSLTSNDIKKIFKSLSLELPKNLDLLIKTIDNQKTDLSILPSGIPVICENLGIFNEFITLKMFSEYILYNDEKKLLIIFNDKFYTKLKTTLTKRKVLFDDKN